MKAMESPSHTLNNISSEKNFKTGVNINGVSFHVSGKFIEKIVSSVMKLLLMTSIGMKYN